MSPLIAIATVLRRTPPDGAAHLAFAKAKHETLRLNITDKGMLA
jgi:hypothetical protein